MMWLAEEVATVTRDVVSKLTQFRYKLCTQCTPARRSKERRRTRKKRKSRRGRKEKEREGMKKKKKRIRDT